MADTSAPPYHDLTHPDYTPPDAPAWCRENLPDRLTPHLGKNGLGSPWCDRPGPLVPGVRGIDRYQANHFIVHSPETHRFLYETYTPPVVGYPGGLLPGYEALAGEVTAGCATDTERAVALLLRGTARVKHPTVPPCGNRETPTGRNCDDETLLPGGEGWCNEQALLQMPDEQLNVEDPAGWRATWSAETADSLRRKMWRFGVINNLLPQ